MTAPGTGTDVPTGQSAVTWWPALTLAERLPVPQTDAPPLAFSAASQRLGRWRKQTTFLDAAAFAAYFAAVGVTDRQLEALLAERAEILHARRSEMPAWVPLLETHFSVQEPGRAIDGLDGFLLLAEPALIWAAERTAARLAPSVQSRGALLFPAGLVEQTVLATLAPQLGAMVERTLVLEMHVARLQGGLAGDTPQARFAAFSARLREPAQRRALLAEYPVLARQLANRARQTSDAVVELLERLLEDWPELQRQFFPGNSPTALASVALGEGDTHRDGRTVAVLGFDGGQKLVYKPRSLAVDAHFQELLAWLNGHGADPAYRQMTVLQRTGYGWIEFVERSPCRTEAEVTRFYVRQGGYLALLYVLCAGDFHFENLLAAGEDPMLIDLEALFHPTLLDYDPERPEHLAQRAIDDSVLSVSLLPQRLRFTGSNVTVDLSGLGAGGTQMTPDKLPVWEAQGTDDMRLRRQHLAFVTEGHRPVLDGDAVDASAQGSAVAHGFRQVFEILRMHSAELLAPDGLLPRFAGVEVRVVARATRIYSLLLQENNHPDLLRDALERDCFYAQLWRDVARTPRLARLVPAEIRDLHNGDVPIFHARPGEVHLWDSHGQCIPDFLPHSGMAQVVQRLRSLNEQDLARQLWYIQASFATLNNSDSHASVRMTVAGPAEEGGGAVDFVAAARTIGDRLAQTAYRHGAHAVWIGLGLDGSDAWSLAPLTMHLYDGHAGVALFLAYLGKVAGERRYTDLAAATLATLRVQVAEQRATFYHPGGFSGWGGIIYALTQLGALWQAPALWQEAALLAEVAVSRLEKDDQFDVIGGAAGLIGALAALWRCTDDASLAGYVAHAADHLVASARPQAEGVGWIVPHMGGRPLAGFSHGTSGIAWALLLAAGITGKERYRDVALAALRYERTLFDPAAQNWRDLRSAGDVEAVAGPAHFMQAWCHGAPGIGLARLAMLAQLDGPALAEEALVALASTDAHGFGGGHSLCHGDFGNLDLFVTAAEVLHGPEWLAAARQRAGALLDRQPQTGWLCGVPGGVETPGLMVGLAGIGYQLLRLADPAAVPSVLLLEAPRIAG